MTESRRADILRKVRALIAKADSTTFEGEAQVFRAKADELMVAYAIEAFEVQPGEDKPKAIRRDFNIDWYWDSPFRSQLWSLFNRLAHHCRCVVVGAEYTRWAGLPVIGMPADLDYFDFLITSLQLQMSKRLEPQVLPELTYDENLAMLKEAGLKWERVGELFRQAGVPSPADRLTGKAMNVAFREQYKAICKRENRQPLRANPETYSRNFADGFVAKVTERLRQMRAANEAAAGDGKSLVLRDIRITVQEEMYNLFPHLRPHAANCRCEACQAANKPVRYSRENRKVDHAAREAGMRAGAEADISAAAGDRMGRGSAGRLGS